MRTSGERTLDCPEGAFHPRGESEALVCLPERRAANLRFRALRAEWHELADTVAPVPPLLGESAWSPGCCVSSRWACERSSSKTPSPGSTSTGRGRVRAGRALAAGGRGMTRERPVDLRMRPTANGVVPYLKRVICRPFVFSLPQPVGISRRRVKGHFRLAHRNGRCRCNRNCRARLGLRDVGRRQLKVWRLDAAASCAVQGTIKNCFWWGSACSSPRRS